MFRVTAKHFCAGGELHNGNVLFTAPILRYMVGWSLARVAGYCAYKGWTID